MIFKRESESEDGDYLTRLPDDFRHCLAQSRDLAVIVCATAKGHAAILGRATCNIGLSSLAGGNDFGFLIAHGIVFYLFIVSVLAFRQLHTFCGKIFLLYN